MFTGATLIISPGIEHQISIVDPSTHDTAVEHHSSSDRRPLEAEIAFLCESASFHRHGHVLLGLLLDSNDLSLHALIKFCPLLLVPLVLLAFSLIFLTVASPLYLCLLVLVRNNPSEFLDFELLLFNNSGQFISLILLFIKQPVRVVSAHAHIFKLLLKFLLSLLAVKQGTGKLFLFKLQLKLQAY